MIEYKGGGIMDISMMVRRNGKQTVKEINSSLGVNVYQEFMTRRSSFWRVNNVKQLRGFIPRLTTPVIGWGSVSNITTGVTYNDGDMVRISSNKAKARNLFNEITVPTVSGYGGYIQPNVKVIRRPLHHRAGQGVTVYEEDETFEFEFDKYYYAELIPKHKEFRVHVGSGKVLLCQEKTPTVDGATNDIVWNHADGRFVFKNIRWNDASVNVLQVAIEAVKRVGLDYGAVDVIVGENGTPYALEVNTSPSLSDYSMGKYVAYFKTIIDWHRTNEDKMPQFNKDQFNETGLSKDLFMRKLDHEQYKEEV